MFPYHPCFSRFDTFDPMKYRCSLPKCQLLSEWKKIEADSSYGVGEFLYFHSLKGSSVSDYNGYLTEQAICLMKNAVQSFRDREKVDSIPKDK